MKKISVSIVFLLSMIIPLIHSYAQSPLMRDNLQVKGIVKNNTEIKGEPASSSYSRGVAEKFTVVFLFIPSGASQAERNGYYYVGKSPDSPTGWILKTDVVEWNHRVCVDFTNLVGRAPALIYDNIDDARAEDWDTNKRPNARAIAQEPKAKSDQRYDMLLPVIEERSIRTKGGCREYQKAYKIAYLGGTADTGPARSNQSSTSNQKTRLDIMFLIDATGSMKDEIEGAKRVVNSVSTELSKMSNTEVRFGISCYRDYGDEYVTRKFLRLTDNYSEVSSALGKIEADGGKNQQEAMYDGVKASITKTKWSLGEDRPVLRVVILIGDASAHPFGDPNNPEGLQRHDLMTLASKHRVRFITVKIMSGTDDDREHTVQLRDLVTGIEDADKGLYLQVEVSDSRSMSNNYISKLTSGIEEEVNRMMELEEVRRGAKDLEDVAPDNRAIFMKNLPASGFPAKGSHFNQGWISEKNDKCKAQVETHVFMTWDDLNLYVFYLQAAISTAQSTSDTKITKVMEDKISAISGEKYTEDMNLGKHLEKRLALPDNGGGILNFTIGEISTWSEARKRHMIESVRDKKKAIEDFMAFPENFRRPSGTSFQYTFIPMRYMPQLMRPKLDFKTSFLVVATLCCILNVNVLVGQHLLLTREGHPLLGITSRFSEIFREPSLVATSGDAVEKYSIIFLFQSKDIPDSLSREFYLIGKTPLEPDGWIPASVVREWNSRLCLKFRKVDERLPALLYRHLDEAMEEDWITDQKPNAWAVAQEPPDTLLSPILFPVVNSSWIKRKGKLTEIQKIYQILYLTSDEQVDVYMTDTLQPASILKTLPYSALPPKEVHLDSGWVTQKNCTGVVQVEEQIFLNFEEFNLVLFYIQAPITVIQSTQIETPDLVSEKISGISQIEYTKDMNLGHHMSQRLSMPTEVSELINFTLEEIPRWSEERKLSIGDKLKAIKKELESILNKRDLWIDIPGTRSKYTYIPLQNFLRLN